MYSVLAGVVVMLDNAAQYCGVVAGVSSGDTNGDEEMLRVLMIAGGPALRGRIVRVAGNLVTPLQPDASPDRCGPKFIVKVLDGKFVGRIGILTMVVEVESDNEMDDGTLATTTDADANAEAENAGEASERKLEGLVRFGSDRERTHLLPLELLGVWRGDVLLAQR